MNVNINHLSPEDQRRVLQMVENLPRRKPKVDSWDNRAALWLDCHPNVAGVIGIFVIIALLRLSMLIV